MKERGGEMKQHGDMMKEQGRAEQGGVHAQTKFVTEQGGAFRAHAQTKLVELQGDFRSAVRGLQILNRYIPWNLVSREDEEALYELFTRMKVE